MQRSTEPICEEDQAQPRGGPSSKSRRSHEEDQAQMVTTQGLERQEPKELSLIKGEGAVSKESTPLKRHRGAKQGGGAVSKESTQLRRTGVVLEGPPVQYSTKRVLSGERESRSSVTGDAVKRYITIPSRHKWSSGSSSTLHHIN